MLTTTTAGDHFRQMLEIYRIPVPRLTIPQAWAVFKEFAAYPIEDAPDVELLFQWGTYDFPEVTERELFHCDFVRQFSIYEDGEYDRMEQLHCLFLYEPTAELRALTGNVWLESATETSFATVEQHPVFQLLTTQYTPLELRVDQEQL